MATTWPSDLHKPTHLLLQGTPFCNIDCTYCYLPGRDVTSRMSLSTLERLCDQLLAHGALGPALRVSWHVGEPLVMGKAEFADACALLQEKLGAHTRLTLSLQTNAVLIDQGWVDLLARRRVKVGVSLDGPREFHDVHRVDRRKRGTHAAVMRGLRLLQEGDIETSVICVLFESSLRAPDRMFDFFVGHGVKYVCFNIEETVGVHTSCAFEVADIRELSRVFFRRYFERVAAHGQGHWVRELNAILDSVSHSDAETRTQVSQPGRVLSVGWRGDVSTYSPELLTWSAENPQQFQLLNIHDQDLSELSRSKTFLMMRQGIDAGHSACRDTCAYFRFCGGGTPAAKMAELGDFAGTETRYCQTKIMSAVDAFVELLVEPGGWIEPIDADLFDR